VNEHDELLEQERERAAYAKEAISEAMRVLPMARGWVAVAIMPDGNPAVMMNLPQYADAICAQQICAKATQIHLDTNFQKGPTQAI
jgi:hypothetical protein